ncbi:50S ribosomal protein L6 [Candidatus Cerribacteria bacterium 'Amazon FNV 2010 28 9']|uniref:Large ribosomal subunit protein uL6 n=1 Tax=Candidatus Cerribacteria bacterium 'Amazon FNV 2010 28 9' TaxID=2081795 RepID=A0A317JSC4_9BACT|nr:MAG: 50S ribosomal protein L6 [Candidatus Cerribacteria bacterium 'Amazon FNV 2010 28 9']
MSRIGRKTISIPAGVTVTVTPDHINVKGPKGELSEATFEGIAVEVKDNIVSVSRQNDEPQQRAAHGLIRSLIANMITGVTTGFEKKLELVGTGYRVAAKGSGITLSLGYSHPIDVAAPAGVTFKVDGNNKISITGISKYAVGQIAANIRDMRPPEPYKGKGVRYEGEVVRRKAGKAAKTGGK